MERILSSDDQLELERKRIRLAQAGDEEAWRLLFDDYYPRLYRFMLRRVSSAEIAEDLAAEVFLDAFRGLPRFQWRGTPFGAWLFKVAHNRLAAHYRSARPIPVNEVEDVPSDSDESVGLDVSDVLERLPADYREAIVLRYVTGLSGAEAAAAMGKSHGAFRMLLHRATQAFKDEYGPNV